MDEEIREKGVRIAQYMKNIIKIIKRIRTETRIVIIFSEGKWLIALCAILKLEIL